MRWFSLERWTARFSMTPRILLDAYAEERLPVARQVVRLTNWLTQLALMDRQLRGVRNFAIGLVSPVVSRRFVWQLSGLAYR